MLPVSLSVTASILISISVTIETDFNPFAFSKPGYKAAQNRDVAR
jgi:hypothetical protein